MFTVILKRLDESVLGVVATRLEARGKHPTFRKMLHEYLDCMKIDDVQVVLDLGCGTGFAVREIAKRPGFSGRIVGVDISPALIEQTGKAIDELIIKSIVTQPRILRQMPLILRSAGLELSSVFSSVVSDVARQNSGNQV